MAKRKNINFRARRSSGISKRNRQIINQIRNNEGRRIIVGNGDYLGVPCKHISSVINKMQKFVSVKCNIGGYDDGPENRKD